MGVSTTSLVVRAQRFVVAGLAAATLSVALGAGAANATTTQSAALSPFCKTLMSFSTVRGAPSVTNVTAYRKWVTTNLPRFQKLESQAPNASVKKVLAELVTIMQSQSKIGSVQQFQKSIAANRHLWSNDFKAFLTTAMSCVTNISNLY